ncbi:MAG: hypothetical protein WD468_00080 [Pirellulales bacterium]
MARIRYHFWIYVGVTLLGTGLGLRMIDGFVLNAESTRMLHNWTGGPATASSLERLALQSDSVARRQVHPPAWLGYALLSAGAVMIANGVIKRSR